MPILPSDAENIARSAEALLAAGRYSEQEIVNRIGTRFGLDPQTDYLRVYTIVRQQRRAMESAQSMLANPQDRLSGNQLPIDWSLNDSQGRYGYRVVVEVTDHETGEVHSTLLIVTSDNPLSASEVLDNATGHAQSFARIGSTTNPLAYGMPRDITDVRIISAGRHP